MRNPGCLFRPFVKLSSNCSRIDTLCRREESFPKCKIFSILQTSSGRSILCVSIQRDGTASFSKECFIAGRIASHARCKLSDRIVTVSSALYVHPKCNADKATAPMKIVLVSAPTHDDSPIPSPVPTTEVAIVCDPALPVISARFSTRIKERWIPALVALADNHPTFFPILATVAIRRKCCGKHGVNTSIRMERSRITADLKRHRLGSASKRWLITDANKTPPSCPSPSFKTQFRAAAVGIAPAPRPTAARSDCIDKTPDIVPTIPAAIVHLT
mmetsp:Transcript_10736/g.23196  ORF Transcript_10736/g.23196 Transcript_10736/m.23196 type:complete len:273 (-) Transcript_10736:323-1141(-)